jgi:hypothetical protein
MDCFLHGRYIRISTVYVKEILTPNLRICKEYVKPVITALNDVIKNAYHTNQRDSAEAGKYN